MPATTRSRGSGPGRGRGGRGRGRGRGEGDPAPEHPPANADMAAILAAMQAMQAQINALQQGGPAVAPAAGVAPGAVPAAGVAPGAVPAVGVAPGAVPAAGVVGAAPANNVAPEMVVPVSAVSLVQWIGMKLDTFDGSGTPVQSADWLTYVGDKMDVFEVVYQDRVRFSSQLLKGEAQIWWKGVQAAHPTAYGPLSWHDFLRQFERRFYPATFLDKMKIDLHNYVQDKKTVTDYEVGFNKIVRFVPHVAYNDMEKARHFCQGLRPSIRHMLGAFPLVDFRTTVEQALGVELQQSITSEMKSSAGEQSRNQSDKKGHSGGPIHKKGKSQRHQPYRGKSSQSSASDKNTPQYRAVAKPGLGLVCFRCGDTHRRSECQWTGKCSICGMDHKDVVCRRNPNGKVHWELVSSSSSASSGSVHMMAAASIAQQQLPMPPTQQYLPAPVYPQYLMAPPTTSITFSTPQFGAFRPPQANAPTLPLIPWASTSGGSTPGSSSTGFPGAYSMPSTDARDRGDVVTGGGASDRA